ncbi:MAG TPA: hypothetical protein VE961_22175 [Pyrinomonadaceae bacterium]|nr:hypothetical protein [Pyrinomonadaceae bacterium]
MKISQLSLRFGVKPLSLLTLSLMLVFGIQGTNGKAISHQSSPAADVPKERPLLSITTTQKKPLTSNWRGLIPLRSTRKDVERLLGSSKDSVAGTYIYDAGVELAHITYSKGACADSVQGRWNVASETVLEIRVYPRTDVPVRDFEPALGIYKRTPDPSIPNWAFYFNNESGVTIQTKTEANAEIVEIVTFGPSSENSELRCKSK